jgi:hypothetical protein
MRPISTPSMSSSWPRPLAAQQVAQVLTLTPFAINSLSMFAVL